MKKLLLLFLVLAFCNSLAGQSKDIGSELSDALIERYQPTINTLTKKGWDHSNSIILHGMEKIYLKNKNQSYLKYIQGFVDSFINEKGIITKWKPELDGLHPGILCLFLFEQTGNVKYKNAATNIRNSLIGTATTPSVFNKTPDGGYWHKNKSHYDDVMTIDGAYMANPFLVKYGVLFNDKESIDIATFQLLLVAERSFNISNNLAYHGWDYTKSRPWANPITGTSTEIWSRSMGWFSMALVDILEYLPKSHKDYNRIVYLFQQIAIGIKNSQNESDGMWYHMMNHKELKDNYPETSGSGMMLYALKKGIKHGWLDQTYTPITENAWKGLKTFITTYEDGKPQINSSTPGIGIQNNVQDYLSVRPVSCPSTDEKQHPHGYCAVLMAASVME
ncbi:glycoside hydrolase family 88 protein [Aurantibacter crassamenti]|uniref:glycoside hydrolase family 88/105 protein n=1 Tax=Aurantibacter crassamenti TaxID=1837375 RepID=UPI001939585D|nr:glycoside hydrolase family 88 protein [Aurantibacter crassamenti]MBM1104531.1 glycoside hydrolase family 88 protein [Aurantibacter crassamenti]